MTKKFDYSDSVFYVTGHEDDYSLHMDYWFEFIGDFYGDEEESVDTFLKEYFCGNDGDPEYFNSNTFKAILGNKLPQNTEEFSHMLAQIAKASQGLEVENDMYKTIADRVKEYTEALVTIKEAESTIENNPKRIERCIVEILKSSPEQQKMLKEKKRQERIHDLETDIKYTTERLESLQASLNKLKEEVIS